jgi:outer membrane protein OmpU
MNKLQKIGVSALAGSLIAMSANAEVSISGGASVGLYQSNKTKATGYFMNDNATITVSGETDGGLTVTTTLELDAGYTSTAPFDNRSISISNEMGTLSFHGHGGDSVMSGWDDVTPSAYEEPWALVAPESVASNETKVQLINGMSADNLWRYDSPTFNGISFHASYLQASVDASNAGSASVDSYNDFGIQIAPEMVEGLSIGYAMGTVEETAGSENDESTMWLKYAYGPVTIGLQASDIDGPVAARDDESSGWGVSYAVSENMSVSYGEHKLDLGNKTDDQESSGFSFSYTAGGATIAGGFNQVDNIGGVAAADEKGYELGVSFAF